MSASATWIDRGYRSWFFRVDSEKRDDTILTVVHVSGGVDRNLVLEDEPKKPERIMRAIRPTYQVRIDNPAESR